MIVYVTRPHNHELVMGGWRDVKVWTDKPDFHHTPVLYDSSTGKGDVFCDKGWGFDGCSSAQPFKQLARQDNELNDNAWNMIAWSACPKGVSLDEWHSWANFMPLKDDGTEQDSYWGYTNWSNLMWHRNKDSDLVANVHHKRFLLEVNLRTNECKIIVPRVYTYNPAAKSNFGGVHECADTQEISHELAIRREYQIHENDYIPF